MTNRYHDSALDQGTASEIAEISRRLTAEALAAYNAESPSPSPNLDRLRRIEAGIEPGAGDQDVLPRREVRDAPGMFQVITYIKGVFDEKSQLELPVTKTTKTYRDDSEGETASQRDLSNKMKEAAQQGATLTFIQTVSPTVEAEQPPTPEEIAEEEREAAQATARIAWETSDAYKEYRLLLYDFGLTARIKLRNKMKTLCAQNPVLYDMLRRLGVAETASYDPVGDSDRDGGEQGEFGTIGSGQTWPPVGAPPPKDFGIESGGPTAINRELLGRDGSGPDKLSEAEIDAMMERLKRRFPEARGE